MFGMTALCYRCGKPATTFINTNTAAASSVPSEFRAVCGEHDVFHLSDGVMVRRETWDAQQAELGRLQAYIRVLENVIAMTDPCIHQELAEHAEGQTMTLEEYIATRQLDFND